MSNTSDSLRTGAIMVSGLIDRNAAVYRVDFDMSGWEPFTSTYKLEKMAGTGSSKREPGDPFVPIVGSRLALARALEDLAKELRQSVKGKISQ